MPVVKKSNQVKKRKRGTEVIAFTARISNSTYELINTYATESKQSMSLALEELITLGLNQTKLMEGGIHND